MPLFGSCMLMCALIVAVVGVVFLFVAAMRKTLSGWLLTIGRGTVVATTVLLTVCCGIIVYALLVSDVTLDYVVHNRPLDGDPLFQIAALWGGRQGSLLFWTWLIGLFALFLLLRHRKQTDKLDVVALALLQLFLVIFIGILVFSQTNNPFVPTNPQYIDPDGNLTGMATLLGMNMLLKHWAMALHPPTLFIGYAGLTVPAAYALATLIVGDASARWVQRANGITVFSWLALGIGIGLGAVWAYVVLGWGGYWGWDPVENASLLPWLIGVALIHAFTIYKNRGSFKRMAIICALLAFVFVVLGTFITRSGIVSSVHAFEGDIVSLILFSALMLLTLVAGAVGLFIRWKSLAANDELDSFASRDAAYYFNAILMVLAALLIAYLTLSSALPTWMPFGGQSFGVVAFNNIVRPAAIIYCALLAVCPMLAWRKTDGKKLWQRIKVPLILAAAIFVILVVVFVFELYPRYGATLAAGGTEALDLMEAGPTWYYHTLALVGFAVASLIMGASIMQLIRMIRFYRKSPGKLRTRFTRLGAYIAHLGIAFCLIGLIGSSMYTSSADVLMQDEPGVSFEYDGYHFEYIRADIEQGDVTSLIVVHLKVSGDSGWYLGSLDPGMEISTYTQMRKLIPSTLSSPLRDVFMVFNGVDYYGNIYLSIKVNPLISSVWLGFGLLVAGALVAACATRSRTTHKDTGSATDDASAEDSDT